MKTFQQIVESLTHGTFAISHTSDKFPDQVKVGDSHDMGDGGDYKVVSKHKNHFRVRNMGSSKTFGVTYKGGDAHAKPNYYKNNTKYIYKNLPGW